MNRVALTLAVGGGYLLGRTKKLKFALGVGSLVLGKKIQANPKAIAQLVSTQLAKNPQFKELGEQLRGDLQGVGRAATGALVNRQLEGLADKLHDRTLGVQDRIAGVTPDISSLKPDKKKRDQDDDGYDDDGYDDEDQDARSGADQDRDEHDDEPAPRKKAAAKKSPPRKAPARRTGAPAKKTAAKRTAKKTTSTARGATRRGGRDGSEGGRDHG